MKRIVKRRGCLLATLLLLACTGCGQKEETLARETCEAFFTAYVNGDSKTASKGLGEPETVSPVSEMQGKLAARTEAVIENVKIDEDTAVVSAVITSIDLEAVLEGLPQEVDSVEKAKEALLQAFDSEEAPRKDFRVEVLLQKRDGEWTVQMTEELADALLGGYYSILRKVLQEVGV